MAIKIQIRGIKELNKFVRVFPNNVSKEINKEQFEFMKRVQKSAKLRAPRWSGALAKSINLKRDSKNVVILTVDSPYGIFQETGYKPHFVQIGRSTRAGKAVADWAASKGLSDNSGSIFVSKFKPFIGPALSSELQKLSNKLNLALDKAIKKS